MKPTILFVDSDPDALASMSVLLSGYEAQWDTKVCQSPMEVMAILASQRVDLVFADYELPDQTGLELLEAIRENPEWDDVSFVMVAKAGDSSLKRQALERGASDLMNKPLELEDLVVRIKSSLKLKQIESLLRDQNKMLDYAVRVRTMQLEASQFEIVYRLAKAAEFRDMETGKHTLRVATCSRVLAEALGFDREYQRLIFLAAMLHDLGKLGIPDFILSKPGPLTLMEFEQMKNHAALGHRILTAQFEVPDEIAQEIGFDDIGCSAFLSLAAIVCLQHHEKYDGTGYPSGLKGEAIDIAGRIVAVADNFDALRSKRVYKREYSESEALQVIREGRGKHFDPEVVDAFLANLPRIRKVYAHLADDDLAFAA